VVKNYTLKPLKPTPFTPWHGSASALATPS